MAEDVRYEVHLDGVDKFERGLSGMKHHADVLHETMGELKKGLVEFFAIEKMIEWGKEAFNAFTEANIASAQLDATLKSTAGAAGISRKELDELSESLSKHSLFTNEAVTSMQSLLLTFTSISKDVIPGAQQAIADMSAKMGTDLKGTAIQVGKALQDPIHGIAALHRVGVNFSEGQKSVIKSLVDTGKTAEAQRLILKELNTEFGGSAQAAAEANPLQFMKNQAEEMLEKVGGAISKLMVDIRPIVDVLLDSFGEIIDIMESSGVGTAFKEVLGIVGQVVKELMGIVKDILPPILKLVAPLVHAFQMIVELVMEIIKPIEEDLAPIIELVVEVVTEIVNLFSSLMPILKPIFHLIGEIAHIFIVIQLAIDHTIIRFIEWLSHTRIFKAVWDSIVFVLEKVVGFIERIVGGIKSLLGIKDNGKTETAKTPAEKIEASKSGAVFGNKITSDIQPVSQSDKVTGTKQVIINLNIAKMNGIEKVIVEKLSDAGNTAGEAFLKLLLGSVNQFSASADI